MAVLRDSQDQGSSVDAAEAKVTWGTTRRRLLTTALLTAAAAPAALAVFPAEAAPSQGIETPFSFLARLCRVSLMQAKFFVPIGHGTDPLLTGQVAIKSVLGQHQLMISVTGALPNSTYNVFVDPAAGGNRIAVSSFKTDLLGNFNGIVLKPCPFDCATGIFVISRIGIDQFVSCFHCDHLI